MQKRVAKVLIVCSILLLSSGLEVLTAQARTSPGRAAVAGTPEGVTMLRQILNGQIPPVIFEYFAIGDPTGAVASYQPGGPTTTSENAFFSSDITTNGRTCFTCHQPQNGWALSPPEIIAQYYRAGGNHPLFAPIDAADCPNSAVTNPHSHSFVSSRSQLFNRGNFRIALEAPNPLGPANPDPSHHTFDGNTDPEWVLVLESDPFDCQMDPDIGLPANLLSVYRRPLPATNVAFVGQDNANELKFDIMWDAREQSLRTQFINATLFHGETSVVPASNLVDQGVRFQAGMFTAQVWDGWGRDLTGDDGSGVTGGPANLWLWRDAQASACTTGVSGEMVCDGIKEKHFVPQRVNVGSELFDPFSDPEDRNPNIRARRESIQRGETLFDSKVFTISFVAGLNDIKGDEDGTEPGTCSTCHSNKNVLNDTAADPKRLGIMDNSDEGNAGVTTMPPTADFPQFAFYCPTDSIPFFSNPVNSAHCPGGSPCDEFITTDPGKGLVTGHCEDLGKMKVPVLRGLASRAPYFHGGNALTLEDLVDFYNDRFNIGFTDQEKADLVNYLNSL